VHHKTTLTFLGLFIVLTFALTPLALAQSGDGFKYFSDTGHTVSGQFLTYFNATGGIVRYGYPITDAYVDSKSGLLIQYFQRARMEWHPDNPEAYKVQLGLLGDELGKRMPPVPVTQIPAASNPKCVYFPETGHSACLKFLDQWRKTGGLDMYGYPISEYDIENEHIVQYFQRAKMEWNPNTQRIELAALGQIYFDYAEIDRRLLEARPDTASPGTARPAVTSVSAKGTVLVPLVSPNGLQTGMVHVSDQLKKGLSNAAVTMVVYFAAGKQSFSLPPTDAKGNSAFSFNVGAARAGDVVKLEFIVSYPGLNSITTRTSYMVWFY
jgi:hypothetical protein